MKPRKFEFHNPASVAEALSMAGQYEDEFMFYAGGTEAIIGLKERVLYAEHVVNLKRIPGLKEIRLEENRLRIGALVTHQELADSPLVRQVLPAYAALSNNVANIRVRCAGTLAGNLCFAEPNADPPALLAALGAEVTLVSAEGQRIVPVREFFDGPYSTVREDAELMSEIVIPVPPQGSRAAYQKVVYLNRPSAGVATLKAMNDGAAQWEIWAGAITGMPERLDAACDLLNETNALDEDALKQAIEQDLEERDVLEGVYGSVDYRKHLVAVLAARTAKECLQ